MAKAKALLDTRKGKAALGLAALVLIAVGILAINVSPAEAKPTHISISLTSTGVLTNAAGTAEITLGHAHSLGVSVSGLTPLTAYLVKADGKLVGALNTFDSGAVDSSWSTSPHGRVLSLPSSANLATVKLIEIVNEGGVVVLTGQFP